MVTSSGGQAIPQTLKQHTATDYHTAFFIGILAPIETTRIISCEASASTVRGSGSTPGQAIPLALNIDIGVVALLGAWPYRVSAVLCVMPSIGCVRSQVSPTASISIGQFRGGGGGGGGVLSSRSVLDINL